MSNTTKQDVSISELYNHPTNADRLKSWAKDKQDIARDQSALVISATGEILTGFASVVRAKERGDSTITAAVKE